MKIHTHRTDAQQSPDTCNLGLAAHLPSVKSWPDLF
jgi:hypothetical protein